MTYFVRIKSLGLGHTHRIQKIGIEEVEEKGLGPEDLIRSNRIVRNRILRFLNGILESEGYEPTTHYQEIAEKLDLDPEIVYKNLSIMEGGAMVERDSFSLPEYRISFMGKEAIKTLNRYHERTDEFKLIREMQPQARGRAFQKIMAKVLEQSGWAQFEGVRNSGEEIDIITYKEREFYLIECKWEQYPIEANVIRDFQYKLMQRAVVQGIVMSMSGFSSGAEGIAEESSGTKAIMLFGPTDAISIVCAQASFEDLLNNKLIELVKHRKVIYS
jgi:hypothetical protein